MRQQTDYNKVVNIAEDGEITVLDYTFDHGDGFKGATGSKFYPVSQDYYEEQTTLKAIEERLSDSVREDEIPNQYAMKTGAKRPYKKWAEAILDAGEEGEFAFDTSYSHLWDYLREVCGHDESSAYIYECVGGGRCFDKDFNGNVNPELSVIIREHESK